MILEVGSWRLETGESNADDGVVRTLAELANFSGLILF
jgi:hypothetical protein